LNNKIEYKYYNIIGHNLYKNKILDGIKEDYIKNQIGCEFLRFKPYDKNFNIFKLINNNLIINK